MIPTETFEQIARHLDRKDLLTLCHVSPFYRDQANRILYRSVFTGRNGIPGKEYRKLVQFIRTIRLAPHLALHVQEFRFVAPHKQKDLTQGSSSSAKTALSSFFSSKLGVSNSSTHPFSSLVNIRKLTVETFETHLPWPEYLNCFPPGTITDLTTYFTISPAFHKFLAVHPTIQSLSFPFLSTVKAQDDSLDLPGNILPSVKRLTAGCSTLPLVDSWRSLTHLQLGCGAITNQLPLLAALNNIGYQLINLMVSGHDGAQWRDSEVLPLVAIAERTPKLEVFSFRLYHLDSVRVLFLRCKP